jgi:hypothetical protein
VVRIAAEIGITTAAVQLEPVVKHCNVCGAGYTREAWDRLKLESSPCAPDGITDLRPIFDDDGHFVRPTSIAVWKQCPPPCCNTLVAFEER